MFSATALRDWMALAVGILANSEQNCRFRGVSTDLGYAGSGFRITKPTGSWPRKVLGPASSVPDRLAVVYIWAYVIAMAHISIRGLQKISAEAISALPGPTAIKSGDRTVALLIPIKAPDRDRIMAMLDRAEELAKERDPAADEAALVAMGVDPTNWSEEAVRALQAERRKLKKA
jgi:hypothetical protein